MRAKRTLDIRAAFCIRESGLRRSGPAALNYFAHRHLPFSGDLASEQVGLIKSALPAFKPMQGHRHDEIEALVKRKGPSQKLAERCSQRTHAGVLEQMNQLPQSAFVRSVRVDCVETLQPQAAQHTPPGFIQRKLVYERSAAGNTAVFGG
jgi:hypothetical protein